MEVKANHRGPIVFDQVLSDNAKQETSLESVSEGKAIIFFHEPSGVFYNAAQTFNRDLSVLVLQHFAVNREMEIRNANKDSMQELVENESDLPFVKKIKLDDGEKEKNYSMKILDALSASGIRAIRFAKEVPFVSEVIANDLSHKAFNLIRKNIEANGVSDIVKYSSADAVVFMMEHRYYDKRFTAIDLDPYGSASSFLDSAVQALCDNGLLMVTCTDMAVLCGNTPEACYAKYNSIGLRHKCCHEFAIRVLLKTIDSCANLHGKYIEPLLSVSVDFYVRIFARIRIGAKVAKDSATKVAYVLACTGCHSLDIQPIVRKMINNGSIKYNPSVFHSNLLADQNKCLHCSHPVHIAGPIYSAPMHDTDFVQNLIKRLEQTPVDQRFQTHNRLFGILNVISEELIDVPLYYEHDQLMHIVKTAVPRLLDIRSAIINAGYRCSISHCNPRALKTDAPTTLLWDVARALAKKNNVTLDRFDENSPGRKILESSIKHTIDFKVHPNALAKSKIDGLLRFQDNKGKNWGPKQKAKSKQNNVQSD